MSFVTTTPEALDYAASKLDGIGTSLAAQNASAAASTTGVAPAAADEVSALQATQFSAYGNLYQQISAEATAINQAFVQMLGLSGASYGTTEASNSAATGTSDFGISIWGQLTQFGQFNPIAGGMTGGTMDGMFAGGPLLGALSSFAQLSQSGAGAGAATASTASAASAAPSLAAAAAPAAVGTAPVLTSIGQAPTVGRLSVPASWGTSGGVPAATPTPATLAGWTSPAAPHDAAVNTVPGGVPSMASTGRTSGLGAPRYGMKPKVMPKPTVV